MMSYNEGTDICRRRRWQQWRNDDDRDDDDRGDDDRGDDDRGHGDRGMKSRALMWESSATIKEINYVKICGGGGGIVNSA